MMHRKVAVIIYIPLAMVLLCSCNGGIQDRRLDDSSEIRIERLDKARLWGNGLYIPTKLPKHVPMEDLLDSFIDNYRQSGNDAPSKPYAWREVKSNRPDLRAFTFIEIMNDERLWLIAFAYRTDSQEWWNKIIGSWYAE